MIIAQYIILTASFRHVASTSVLSLHVFLEHAPQVRNRTRIIGTDSLVRP